MHAEAHVAGLPFDAELVQQGDVVGVGAVVENDKAGIDGILLSAQLDVVRVGVAACMAT